MELLKLTSIIIFFCPLYTASEYLETLPDDIIPEQYDIQLFQDVYTNAFRSGKCRVSIRIDRPTQNIYLHAQLPQIIVDNIHLINSSNSSNFYVPIYYIHDEDNDILNIHFSVMLLRGHYILDIEYSIVTEINDIESLSEISVVDQTGYTTSLIATHFQAIGARQIFPCWDDPAFQATFNISVEHDSKYFAVSNMPVRKREMKKYDRKVTYFVKTPVMPTYRVAIMVSNYTSILHELTDSNMGFYSRHNIISYITFAMRTVANVMHHLESNWKYYNISSKMNYVVAGFPHDCTENMGLTLYRDTVITYDEKSDPIAHKLNVMNIIACSVVRQAIDNYVTPSSWSFAWINEGISTFLAIDAINKIYPDFRLLDLFVVQVQQESLRLDTNSIMKPLTSEANSPSEIKSLFSFSYYKKAPTMLRMLQHVVTYIATEEVFQNGIEKFLQNHLANSDNLWAAMQTAQREYSRTKFFINKEEVGVKEIMNPWTKFKHYPVLEVKRNNYTHVKISLEDIEKSISLDQQMDIRYHQLWIPVILFTQDSFQHENLPIYSNMWLNSAEHDKREIYFHSHDLNIIIVNVQQIGYYRVKYHDNIWIKITQYLNTTHYTKVPVLSRAQLIDDAFYFLTQNQFHMDGFLNLVQYLQQETDYVAWYPMIKALEYMSCFFPFRQSAYIKENIRNILGVLLKNISYTEKSDDNELVKCLRQEVAKWACILNDQTCKKNAIDKFKWHLDNPITNKLLPWWRKWTYRNGLISSHDQNVTFWSILNSWINKSDNRLLEFLSCGVFPYNFSNYIMINMWENSTNYIIRIPKCKDESMQVKERVNCFFFIIVKYARTNLALKFMLENLEKITPRKINIYATYIVIINHLYSVELIDEVTKFIDSYGKEIQNYFYISKFQDLEEKNLAKYKINKCLEEFRNLTFSLIKSKLKIRLSEITNQLNYFLPFQESNFKNEFV